MATATSMEQNHNFILVADHPALDLLNTVAVVDGVLTDLLGSDRDAAAWLEMMGYGVGKKVEFPAGELLRAVKDLRETVRALVEDRVAERTMKLRNVAALNRILAAARSHVVLSAHKSGDVRLKREWQQNTAEQALAPLAEAAAEFLAGADFALVRKCESDDCVLWFYDRTKSHHRRWCSTATCGNRHKVAAFRRRREGSG